MRLLVALMLVAISPAAIADNVPTRFLIHSAANDFRVHGPRDIEVIDVHIGHRRGKDDQAQYVLCGRFRLPGEVKWQRFATIQTSGYEQWLGGQAVALCDGKEIQLDRRRDLTSELQIELRAVATGR